MSYFHYRPSTDSISFLRFLASSAGRTNTVQTTNTTAINVVIGASYG